MNDVATSSEQLSPIPTILVIDDMEERLEELTQAINKLADGRVAVIGWKPAEEENALDRLQNLKKERIDLVITDFDLTHGLRGLYGDSVVAWCQRELIPVGEYSRRFPAKLPGTPKLLEHEFSADAEVTAESALNVCLGFDTLSKVINEKRAGINLPEQELDAVLATALRRSDLKPELGTYLSSAGRTISEVFARKNRISGREEQAHESSRDVLDTYVVGHVLRNSVMKFPGPLLSESALCSFFACSDDESIALTDFFSACAYEGPFSSDQTRYFWSDLCEALIEEESQKESYIEKVNELLEQKDFESAAEERRALLETILERSLENHTCDRCAGVRGGYRCPYTNRTVCDRTDCSVSSSDWIPKGAYLSRIEMDFFETNAPLMDNGD